MEFTESMEKCYTKGQAFESGDYKVVFYEWSMVGHAYFKNPHWSAYKRIDGLKGRPFGNHVNPSHIEYKTRKQAERACLS